MKTRIAWLFLLMAVPAWAQEAAPWHSSPSPAIAPDIDHPPVLKQARVNAPDYNDSALYDDSEPTYEDDADTDADERGGALRNMLISVGN